MKRNNTIYINNAYDSVCTMNAFITFSYSFNLFYYKYNYIIIKKMKSMENLLSLDA
jgi:hypothetical protein